MKPAAILLFCCCSLVLPAGCRRVSTGLPAGLPDSDFWRLSQQLSEPPGVFDHSENLVSNEIRFVHAARLLRPRGGVYIGVGPEQNFTYIARLRPAMAFIVDVRNENRNLHLLYKALFELSTDRAEFVSRLFSRPRPQGLGAGDSVGDLFERYAAVDRSAQLRDATLRAVRERLTARGLALSPADLAWIEHTLTAFSADGPDIHYGRARPDDPPGPSYRTLMTAVDLVGRTHSFLATEDGFGFVKQLQSQNLIVPVVGDFAGPDTIRRIADYVRGRGAVVSAFYGSNVEVYLNRQRTAAFCRNLSMLPIESGTRFIGSKAMQPFAAKLASCGTKQ